MSASATPTAGTPAPASLLRRARESLPTVAVVVVLVALAFWGHETGWSLPKFSALIGAADKAPEDWCEAHGVPESQCVECNASVMPKVKDFGWCKLHRVHQCPWCHPEVAQLAKPYQPSDADMERAERAIALTARPKNNSRCTQYRHRVQFATTQAAEKAGVDVAPAWVGPIEEAVSSPGQIGYDPSRVLHVASRVTGAVWRVEKQIGDRVSAGDILAIVDSAEVGKAKADLLHAVAERDVARAALERKQAATGAVAGRDLQEARAAVRESELKLAAVAQLLGNLGLPFDVEALAELNDIELQREVRLLGLPKSIAANLDPTATSGSLIPIRSSFAGVISAAHVVAGELVDATKELFTVIDARRMWLSLDVRAEDARLIRAGQTVRFKPDGGDDVVSGKLTWVSPAADEKTRTVKARAELDNADGALRAFTFGLGRIVLREEKQTVLIPSDAVQHEGCCSIVFVRDKDYLRDGSPKVFHVREVQVGAITPTDTELIAGLLPGEVVAIKGAGALRAELLKNNLGAG